ncbi:MAG: TIGR01777 family oxidoreductase, partial [Flavitalea sp.]
METILITGGTGLIGKTLSQMLIAKGYQVIILSRSAKPPRGGLSFAVWDIQNETIDLEVIRKADHIIHLAGAGVADKRWSAKRKREIVDSRVKSGELLVNALKNNNHQVKTLVSSSAIGWYGPDPSIPNPHPFVESDPPAKDFLGEACKVWEQSVQPITQQGIRLVVLRTGIVLSNDGGAFVEFKRPLAFGLATILGSGKQMISWIHIDDLCRIYISAIENNKLQGTYNAVAPHPVSNKEMVLKMASRMRGKTFMSIHVPAFALKIALGEMSIEVLKSATVNSKKISQAGFNF